MQTLILFTLILVTLTLALPQGYHYDRPSSSLTEVLPPIQTSSSNLIQSTAATLPSPEYLPPPSQPSSKYLPPSSQYLPPGGDSLQPPLIRKYFYIHAVPEEQTEQTTKVIRIGEPRKNYRVIFIKAPTSGIPKSLQIAPAPVEERTAIYILAQKPDLSDIQTDFTQQQAEPTKPEVHFVRYKTTDEAENFQRQIQAQYDSLGGTSIIANEGLAPVQNVIGSLDGANQIGSQSQQQRTYLPPNNFV